MGKRTVVPRVGWLWTSLLLLLGTTVSTAVIADIFVPNYDPPMGVWALAGALLGVSVLGFWLERPLAPIPARRPTRCLDLSPAARQELTAILAASWLMQS